MIIDGSKLKRRRVEEDELEVKDATINATGDSTDLNTQEFNDRDVDDMSDAEVMNYAFINMPKNIEIGESIEAEVKIRYSARPAKAAITRIDIDRAKIHFDYAQSAITPGQSAVGYSDGLVVFGGEIE